MKIVIATPLYPPDIGGAAAYVKELAARLTPEHSVAIATYGRLPEHVDKISFVLADKRRMLPIRLFLFTVRLIQATRSADLLYVENGASVELPAIITTFLTRTPLILHIGDVAAYRNEQHHPLKRLLLHLIERRAQQVVRDVPHARPEILPFAPYPETALRKYEQSWESHLHTLTNTILHARAY